MPDTTKHVQFDPFDQERVELETHKETSHDDYTPDTQGDPEGSALRADYKTDLPEWVFRDFELSDRDFYGKVISKDGAKLKLVPKKQTIEEIKDVHEQGMLKESEVTNCLIMGTKQPEYQGILEAYELLIEAMPSNDRYDVMRGLQNTCETRLAERAIAKYRFLDAIEQNQKEERLDDLMTKAMAASARAGIYLMVHQALWKRLQYKGEPNYIGVERAITWAQIRSAEWLQKTYGNEPSVSRAKMQDYSVDF